MSKTDKTAKCIREVENWSNYENKHKLDNSEFNQINIKKNLHILSPKINNLINKINELDTDDLRKDGRMYKHLIFSDLKTNGGAKSVASAFIANGFSLIYDTKLEIHQSIRKNPKNFALLTSTKLYQKDIGIRFRRKVLELFNRRPDNVNGEQCRFLILDAGFKEGIDVFDIRYIHILETPITYADEKQIIGRGTRMCGQTGLHFDKESGWPLYIFKYRTSLPDRLKKLYKEDYLYDLFLKNSNINPALINFSKELEKRAIQSSVDLYLNKELHIANPVFKELYNEVLDKYPVTVDTSLSYAYKYGKKIEKFGPFNCKNGCKGKILAMPTEFMLLVWYMAPQILSSKINKDGYPINDKKPKWFLCKQIETSKAYCDRLNKAWHQPDLYILKNETKILEVLNRLPKIQPYIQQIKNIKNYISLRLSLLEMSPEPPTKEMNYQELHGFINLHYKKQVWEKIKIENLCESINGGVAPLKFTPTQDFVRNYFQPSSIYKGMLFFHSTGTGKTCSGIATASSSFEKEGYTILWVTRNTLKGDVWKNMYQQVCSTILRENMPNDFDLEEALRKPLQYVSDRWMLPITYKQLSNLLLKRNKLYDTMVQRNGVEDPLKKTLIIIDEAHKLLSSDLNFREKIDFNVLTNAVHNSYNISNENSVRLLLMTATPYTDDPMQMIKLINLLKLPNQQIQSTFEEFQKAYLNDNGEIKNPKYIIDLMSGYISYLNREQDIRQFANPIISTIDVALSESNNIEKIKEVQILTKQFNESNEIINKHKMELQNIKNKIKLEYTSLMEKCKKIKEKNEKKNCKDEIQVAISYLKNNLLNKILNTLNIEEENKKSLKLKIQKLNYEIKNYKENDLSQERALIEKCLN